MRRYFLLEKRFSHIVNYSYLPKTSHNPWKYLFLNTLFCFEGQKEPSQSSKIDGLVSKNYI